MELPNFNKNYYSHSFQNEINQIDNIIENISFQSRNDNSLKNDNKIINSIKSYLIIILKQKKISNKEE